MFAVFAILKHIFMKTKGFSNICILVGFQGVA